MKRASWPRFIYLLDVSLLKLGKGGEILANALAASCSISRSFDRILSSRRMERLAILLSFPSISWTDEKGLVERDFWGLVVDSLSRFSFLSPDSESEPFRFSGENTSRTSPPLCSEFLEIVRGISTTGFLTVFPVTAIEVSLAEISKRNVPIRCSKVDFLVQLLSHITSYCPWK